MAQTPPTPRHGERRLDVRPSGLPPVPWDLTAKVVGDFRGSSSGSGQLGGEEAGSLGLGRGWSRRCLWVRGEGMRGAAGSPCSATAPPPAPAPPLPAAEMGPCAHVPFPTKGSQSSGLDTQGGSGQLCMPCNAATWLEAGKGQVRRRQEVGMQVSRRIWYLVGDLAGPAARL